MFDLPSLYEIYLLAKKLLGIDIEEARSLPFILLIRLLNREIEALKESMEEKKEEKPVEEEIPAKTLKSIEEIILKVVGEERKENK